MTYRPLEMSPTEDFPFEVNFGVGDWDALFASDPINAAACTIRDWSDVALAGPFAGSVGSPAVSGKVVQFRVTNPPVGDYQIKVKAVSTTNAYDAEEFLLLHVRRPTVP